MDQFDLLHHLLQIITCPILVTQIITSYHFQGHIESRGAGGGRGHCFSDWMPHHGDSGPGADEWAKGMVPVLWRNGKVTFWLNWLTFTMVTLDSNQKTLPAIGGLQWIESTVTLNLLYSEHWEGRGSNFAWKSAPNSLKFARIDDKFGLEGLEVKKVGESVGWSLSLRLEINGSLFRWSFELCSKLWLTVLAWMIWNLPLEWADHDELTVIFGWIRFSWAKTLIFEDVRCS